MNAEVMRFPAPGTKVLYADRHGVLHARPHCDTVPSQILQWRIGPADEEPRCAVCCADLVED